MWAWKSGSSREALSLPLSPRGRAGSLLRPLLGRRAPPVPGVAGSGLACTRVMARRAGLTPVWRRRPPPPSVRGEVNLPRRRTPASPHGVRHAQDPAGCLRMMLRAPWSHPCPSSRLVLPGLSHPVHSRPRVPQSPLITMPTEPRVKPRRRPWSATSPSPRARPVGATLGGLSRSRSTVVVTAHSVLGHATRKGPVLAVGQNPQPPRMCQNT